MLASFISDYSLAESIQRLQAEVVPPGFDGMASESAMGTVAEEHVRLEHNLPWPSSPEFRFYFTGSFQQKNGRVVLTGRFVESGWSKWSRWSQGWIWPILQRPFHAEVEWLSAVIRHALTRPA